MHSTLDKSTTPPPTHWDGHVCFLCVPLWNLGLALLMGAVLLLPFLLRIILTSRHCWLAHIFMEVRENLLATSLCEFCRCTTGASKVLLGRDL